MRGWVILLLLLLASPTVMATILLSGEVLAVFPAGPPYSQPEPEDERGVGIIVDGDVKGPHWPHQAGVLIELPETIWDLKRISFVGLRGRAEIWVSPWGANGPFRHIGQVEMGQINRWSLHLEGVVASHLWINLYPYGADGADGTDSGAQGGGVREIEIWGREPIGEFWVAEVGNFGHDPREEPGLRLVDLTLQMGGRPLSLLSEDPPVLPSSDLPLVLTVEYLLQGGSDPGDLRCHWVYIWGKNEILVGAAQAPLQYGSGRVLYTSLLAPGHQWPQGEYRVTFTWGEEHSPTLRFFIGDDTDYQ